MIERSLAPALPLLAIVFVSMSMSMPLRTTDATAAEIIPITTADTSLTLYADDSGMLYQLHYGTRPTQPINSPSRTLIREDECHPPFGNGYILEPALFAIHADGNTSTDLEYVSHSTSKPSDDVALTRIDLKDRHYPFFVSVIYKAYQNSNVIEQWTEIRHEEDAPVVLERFASSAPVLKSGEYWLTQLQGNYIREVELVEEKLTPGIKVLDSKLGVRAHQMRNPSFLISLDGPANEETGVVVGGTLAWSGSFHFAFDIDWNNRLRAVCGINPLGAEHRLAPGETFTTPAMLWTVSDEGKGGMSRNFHRWARSHGIRDGDKPRPVLLNNWEATYFDFDEARIVSLFDGARDIGAELFLLDDGWFGNKYPRNDDRAGLGDWEVNKQKLPHGLSHLADEADKRGIGFGIWIEPEMVNPKSELYEQHPDWVITQPHRELLFGRNQLVLDLTRPEVQAHVREVIDDTLAPNPGITYVKWDCNRFVTQPGSSHLPADEQQHLLIDYQWELYRTMEHFAKMYPNVMAMVCSGGSGRVDYGSLRYFHSFWPSDNTDPLQRIFIQWGFSHFFPAQAISAHVTDMGEKPLKLAIDVALSGAMGVDRDISRWTPEERQTVAASVALYKDRIRKLVHEGDLHRLESPYERPRAVLSYVSEKQDHAVVFIYRLRESTFTPVKPRGLDPARRYRVREINLAPDANSRLSIHGQVLDGATLMREGFNSPLRRALQSAVIELTAEPALEE